MTIPKHLISSFLLLLLAISQVGAYSSSRDLATSCDRLKVETIVDNVKMEMSVKVNGEQGRARLFLFDAKGTLLNERDLFQKNFNKLQKGSYTILVVDASGCSKETEFTLQ